MRLPTTDLTLDRFLMKDWADEKGDESENVKGESQRLRFYQRKKSFLIRCEFVRCFLFSSSLRGWVSNRACLAHCSLDVAIYDDNIVRQPKSFDFNKSLCFTCPRHLENAPWGRRSESWCMSRR